MSTHTALRRARIDFDVFIRNVHNSGDPGVVDLSANAFGHGALEIARCARDAGITEFTVSRPSERARLVVEAPDIDIHVAPINVERVGAHFGLAPQVNAGVEPVMTLESTVMAVKRISRGGGVSYGYTWKAPEDGWLALCALGYGDGFNRAWGNRVTAHIDGNSYLAVGRVAMDAHSVFTADDQRVVGESVTYFGHGIDDVTFASELATLVGCSPLVITSNLGVRVSREYSS